jgi:hypothetical protein
LNKEQLLKTIEEVQESVKQMVQDDLEENPEAANEEFQCDCCAGIKMQAGSLVYEDYKLCNDCVLLAEAGFALNKIKNIDELMASMEEKRFETVYNALFNVDETKTKDKD